MEINISKSMGFVVNKMKIKSKFVILFLISSIIIFSFTGIKAFGGSFPVNMGHSDSEIMVIVGGSEKNLNQAFSEFVSTRKLNCEHVYRSFSNDPMDKYSSEYQVNNGRIDCTDVFENPSLVGYTIVGGSCIDIIFGDAQDPPTNEPTKSAKNFPVNENGKIKWECEAEPVNGIFKYSIRVVCCK
jgi:hypothetical protein